MPEEQNHQADYELFRPVKLHKSANLDLIDCENQRLNHWISRRALAWQSELGRDVFVISDRNGAVQAYYSLSTGIISANEGHGIEPKRVILVNRMGISKQLNAEIIAEHLMRGIFIKAARVSTTTQIEALVIKATDEQLVPLYARLGFVGFSKSPFGAMLVKSMRTIRSEAWLSGHID